MKKLILLLLALLYGSLTSADAIDMRDYTLVKNEITEAEVLYKFGAPDHETVNSDFHRNILSKTWFYIPKKNGTNKWISEFKFDGNGRLITKDRYRINYN
jgi:hypothetical protein